MQNSDDQPNKSDHLHDPTTNTEALSSSITNRFSRLFRLRRGQVTSHHEEDGPTDMYFDPEAYLSEQIDNPDIVQKGDEKIRDEGQDHEGKNTNIAQCIQPCNSYTGRIPRSAAVPGAFRVTPYPPPSPSLDQHDNEGDAAQEDVLRTSTEQHNEILVEAAIVSTQADEQVVVDARPMEEDQEPLGSNVVVLNKKLLRVTLVIFAFVVVILVVALCVVLTRAPKRRPPPVVTNEGHLSRGKKFF